MIRRPFDADRCICKETLSRVAWVVTDYEADPRLLWRRVISLDSTAPR